MIKNIGGTEKGIRIMVGGLLILAAVVLGLPTWANATLGVIGGIALLTGAVGYCPAWTLFGLNTCRANSTPSIQKEG